MTNEKLINFKVYLATGELLGLADVELPTIEPPTETISGAGIAGEVESPTLGHTGPMSLTLNWRTTEEAALRLLAPAAHPLEIRGSIQRWNPALGIWQTLAVKVVVRAVPKSTALGKLAPGASMEPASEFSVRYLKLFLGGRAWVEIDPINSIFVVEGFDYLAQTRVDLGG